MIALDETAKDELVSEIRRHIAALDVVEHEKNPEHLGKQALLGRPPEEKHHLRLRDFRVIFTRLRHPGVGLYRQISVSRTDGKPFAPEDQKFFQSVFERAAGVALVTCGFVYSNRVIQAIWA